jgi:hypothetical protein
VASRCDGRRRTLTCPLVSMNADILVLSPNGYIGGHACRFERTAISGF